MVADRPERIAPGTSSQVECLAEALDQGDRTGAGAAARAKAAPFTAKRHQVFMSTTIALDAQKTVFQQAFRAPGL